ncbi:MAG TPA: FAD-dependent oxidoreductase [Thioalkalivibrio sp.]|nr:FAD-dependent oxidoreductase [Thioalkalivibrio sp.]
MHAPVVIIGAGWAGIAAGVELARHGLRVTLLESAGQPGGRARSVEIHGLVVDNGQHLLIGAYGATLALLRHLGIAETAVLARLPLQLDVRRPDGPALALAAPRLPAPLHLLVALLRARGLSWAERRSALAGLPGLMRWDESPDISVSGLLERYAQPDTLRRMLWEPLCVAALNVAPGQASARVFTRMLRESFSTTRAASDLLIPRRALGEVVPQPGADYIRRHGGGVHYGTRCRAITTGEDRNLTVCTDAGRYAAQDVVVATAPVAAQRLLGEFADTAAELGRLNALGDEPIATVYLQYPPDTRLDTAMTGLAGGIVQWVFDRRVANQPGLLAVVISASGPHTAMDTGTLAEAVATELAGVFPGLGMPEWTRVIREKRATFRCTPGSDALRPANATTHPGLWLAGDYTDTGLPATLEGAVRSGLECAHAILNTREIEIKAC